MLPLLCSHAHSTADAELASAVSNAGGLGILTALTQPSPEDLRKEIRKCKTMTSRPFAVNLTLLPSMVPPNYDAYAQVVIDEGIKIGIHPTPSLIPHSMVLMTPLVCMCSRDCRELSRPDH